MTATAAGGAAAAGAAARSGCGRTGMAGCHGRARQRGHACGGRDLRCGPAPRHYGADFRLPCASAMREFPGWTDPASAPMGAGGALHARARRGCRADTQGVHRPLHCGAICASGETRPVVDPPYGHGRQAETAGSRLEWLAGRQCGLDARQRGMRGHPRLSEAAELAGNQQTGRAPRGSAGLAAGRRSNARARPRPAVWAGQSRWCECPSASNATGTATPGVCKSASIGSGPASRGRGCEAISRRQEAGLAATEPRPAERGGPVIAVAAAAERLPRGWRAARVQWLRSSPETGMRGAQLRTARTPLEPAR